MSMSEVNGMERLDPVTPGELLKEEFLEPLGSVSYTHLDVYKRQYMNRSPSPFT